MMIITSFLFSNNIALLFKYFAFGWNYFMIIFLLIPKQKVQVTEMLLLLFPIFVKREMYYTKIIQQVFLFQDEIRCGLKVLTRNNIFKKSLWKKRLLSTFTLFLFLKMNKFLRNFLKQKWQQWEKNLFTTDYTFIQNHKTNWINGSNITKLFTLQNTHSQSIAHQITWFVF